MAAHVILFMILNILNCLLAEDCVLRVPVEAAWDKELHKDLWKNYKSYLPPSNQSCVQANIRISLKTFVLDETEGVFTIKVWTRMNWIDERLSWSPDDYGGIKKIIKHSSRLWTPAFKLIHGVYPPFTDMFFSDCSITNEGKVLCVAQVVYDTFCSSKLRNWPYDVQDCTLEFGDDDRFGITKFVFPERVLSMFGAEFGLSWYIMEARYDTNVSSVVKLAITLTLERQAYGLVIIVVVPCIVLSLLTFTSTLLRAEGFVRLGFSCFCLISHFIFTGTIDELLPKHSADTPVILFYATGSTIVSLTCVIMAYVLTVIIKKRTVPRAWIIFLTNKVTGSFGKFLLFPKWSDDLDTEDVNINNKNIWLVFANIINSIYIVIVVIVYICLFSIYMPKKPPLEY